MGDPAGVGPEIICKALAEMDAADCARVRVFGSRDTLARAAEIVGAGGEVSGLVEDIPLDGGPVPFGRLDPRAGEASFRFIERAVRAAQAGEIGCIVTAPINKAALNAAGHHYDGHTGMLAALTGARASFMLLASERMSVIHVSTHVSLHDAIERATTQRVLDTIR